MADGCRYYSTFNLERGSDFNYGLPLANVGICQIAQNKNSLGIYNLMKAYENDKKTLDENGLDSTDPETAIINSILFNQFEYNKIIPVGLYQQLSWRIEGKGFKTQKSFSDLIQVLTAHERLHLFFVMSELNLALSLIENGNNFISRGKILVALFGVCHWLENRLKSLQNRPNDMLANLVEKALKLKYPLQKISLKSTGYTSITLDDLYNNIEINYSAFSNPDFGYMKMLCYIRNYAGHNYSSIDSDFFKESIKYALTLVYIVLEYGY